MQTLQKFITGGTILLAFIFPFSITYHFQERQFLQQAHAESIGTLTPIVRERTELVVSTTTSNVRRAKTAPKTSSPKKVSLSSYIKVTSETQARKILAVIADCESEGNPTAKNPRSSAKGLLQILDSTWDNFECSGNPYDAEDNMRCGVKIATESGLQHWNPSKYCWSPVVHSIEN